MHRHLRHNIKAYIYRGEDHYVAECMDISVVTQGRTLDETVANLQEAIDLYLEGEEPAEYGLAANPTILGIGRRPHDEVTGKHDNASARRFGLLRMT